MEHEEKWTVRGVDPAARAAVEEIRSATGTGPSHLNIDNFAKVDFESSSLDGISKIHFLRYFNEMSDPRKEMYLVIISMILWQSVFYALCMVEVRQLI